MPRRLESGGLLIDRDQPIDFTFNGQPMTGYEGDTLASALLGAGHLLVGRSFKYHRPRGIVASGAEEPNALMGIGQGARFEPNQRATTVELHAGMAAESQNHWPSLERDVGALNSWVASKLPIFSAGFYYKTFLFPRVAWKHLYEPLIRRAAGLGKAPKEPDPDRYEHYHVHVDTLVVGGGVAGLRAAEDAARDGGQVLLVEQTAHWGGRTLVDGDRIEGQEGPDWVTGKVGALSILPNVAMRTRTMAAGVYDHGYVLLMERVADHRPGLPGAPRHRLWRVRARNIVLATGAIERPMTFANNDLPGVMLASAVRDYVRLWGVLPGKTTVLFTNNDDAYRTALALKEVGGHVSVVDVRSDAKGALPARAREAGIEVRTGHAVVDVAGKRKVEDVRIAPLGAPDKARRVRADIVAVSSGWNPAVHLWSHCGGKLRWDDDRAMFLPDPDRPPSGADGAAMARVVGAAAGDLHLASIVPGAEAPEEAPLAPHWFTPAPGKGAHGTKHFVDFQNDVTAADIRLAAAEGYESVEHAKRYTTLGMATDQGKTSNINGLAILAEARGARIPEVGTTTFRPPYTPISMGVIAGQAKGDLFKAVRRSPIHEWHEAEGADWEPVGDWRRPFCYPRAGEDRHAAVNREVLAARNAVGLLDASTLGKIEVKGPDAGQFLDLIYTGKMSTLKPGRCRYGLMCTENGFLFDDGVVVCLGQDHYLLHTTTGGSDRVHAHLEEWLQTEWWDLKVWTANVTDQWAQIAVVGPKARRVLEGAGIDLDLSALPFMAYADATVAEQNVRVFRISFSGELSYEVAVPSGAGLTLWRRFLDAGAEHGVTPYGTEAMHVLRAEKGFIMIGDETDGTVIPQDLGLGWAISKTKTDFIGMRAQQREDLTRAGRKQLVGLRTENPKDVLPDGAHAVRRVFDEIGMETIGHVTSTYWSPTLERSIAMGLVEDGLSRRGEWLDFPVSDGVMRAEIVDPVFYDPEGTKQNV